MAQVCSYRDIPHSYDRACYIATRRGKQLCSHHQKAKYWHHKMYKELDAYDMESTYDRFLHCFSFYLGIFDFFHILGFFRHSDLLYTTERIVKRCTNCTCSRRKIKTALQKYMGSPSKWANSIVHQKCKHLSMRDVTLIISYNYPPSLSSYPTIADMARKISKTHQN